jgi:UDP:flavonoid glycosyltransferase YjiC (YdhE family)
LESMEECAKEAAGFITDGGVGELQFALNHK